jgi:WD40 repeat protein
VKKRRVQEGVAIKPRNFPILAAGTDTGHIFLWTMKSMIPILEADGNTSFGAVPEPEDVKLHEDTVTDKEWRDLLQDVWVPLSPQEMPPEQVNFYPLRRYTNLDGAIIFQKISPSTSVHIAEERNRVQNMPTCNQAIKWKAHTEMVDRLHYIRDPPSMASSSPDFTISLWSLNGEKLGSICTTDTVAASKLRAAEWAFPITAELNVNKHTETAMKVTK